MDKEELLRMASDTGLSYLDGASKNEYGHWIDDEIEAFANAILERAAQECDKIEGMYWHGDGARAATDCAEVIRAMKG